MSEKLLAALLTASAGLLAQPGPLEGLAGSPVQVVIYEDLQCPDCAAFRKMLDEKLLPRYGGKVAFLHRDFPLAKHAWARQAAIAARFFYERSPALGLRYRRETMAGLREITTENFPQKLAAFAAGNGVPAAEALSALKDTRLAALVEQDFQEGVARGISKTPTVLVSGTAFVETFTFEEISKAIEQALAEAR
jgi:protein-disulfide isomerase